jgi:hypothetical protein
MRSSEAWKPTASPKLGGLWNARADETVIALALNRTRLKDKELRKVLLNEKFDGSVVFHMLVKLIQKVRIDLVRHLFDLSMYCVSNRIGIVNFSNLLLLVLQRESDSETKTFVVMHL